MPKQLAALAKSAKDYSTIRIRIQQRVTKFYPISQHPEKAGYSQLLQECIWRASACILLGSTHSKANHRQHRREQFILICCNSGSVVGSNYWIGGMSLSYYLPVLYKYVITSHIHIYMLISFIVSFCQCHSYLVLSAATMPLPTDPRLLYIIAKTMLATGFRMVLI